MDSTIKYKLDKKTPHDETGEWDYWGKKSSVKELSIKDEDEILELLEEKGFMGIHEVVDNTRGCKPYFDIDKKFQTQEEFEANHYLILNNAKEKIQKLFPRHPESKVKYKIIMFDSSGFTGEYYKVSGHFIVEGAGYIQLSKESNRIKEIVAPYEKSHHFDLQIYTNNHLMRFPYVRKPNSQRILKRAFLDVPIGKVTVIELKDIPTLPKLGFDAEEWPNWLITYQGDENLIPLDAPVRFKAEKRKPKAAVVNKEVKATKPKKDEDDEFVFSGEHKYPQMSFEKIRYIINNVSEERATNYESWLHGIWALANYADEYDMDDDEMHDIAQEFAERGDNYDEHETTKNYESKRTRDKQITMGTLIYWLKQDNLEAYKKLFTKKEVKPPTGRGEETDIAYSNEIHLLLQTNPDEIDVKNWMLRCLRLDCGENREDWYGRCREGWKQIGNNSKSNFPFSTRTTKAEIVVGKETMKNGKDRDIKKEFSKILEELQFSQEFNICRVNGVGFWPYFKPEDDDPKIINRFGGWVWSIDEPIDGNENITFLNNHIGLLFGDAAEYVKKWLACCIQKPREKMPMIVAYSRKEGVGKNLLQKLITGAIGKQYIKAMTGTKHILGDFNGACEETLITFLNEGKEDGKSIYDSETFKSVITDLDLLVNRKFKEAKQGCNWSKYIGFTNNKNAFPIAANDRRFITCESSCEMVGNRTYFKKLASLVENPEVQEQYFKYLAQLDISDFDYTHIPNTSMRQDLQLKNLVSPFKHIIAICNDERPLMKDEEVFNITRLYNDYKEFCDNIGVHAFNRSNYKEAIEKLQHLKDSSQTHRIDGEVKRGYLLSKPEIEASFKEHLNKPDFKLEDCKDL